MRATYGVVQIVIALLCVGVAIIHGYEQLFGFADRMNDPEYSRVMLYGKLLVPVLFLLLGYRSARSGLEKFRQPAKQ